MATQPTQSPAGKLKPPNTASNGTESQRMTSNNQEETEQVTKMNSLRALETAQKPQCPNCSNELIFGQGRLFVCDYAVLCSNKNCKLPAMRKYVCTTCLIHYCRHVITPHKEERDRNDIANMVQSFVAGLTSIGETETGLDVYQTAASCSIWSSTKRNVQPYVRAFITGIVQILGCCLFIIQLLSDFRASSENKWCETTHSVAQKILAMGLVMVTSGVVQYSSIMRLGRQGMYPLLNLYKTQYYFICDHLVQRQALVFGYIVNEMCMTLTICGSIAIVFTAESVVDLVLNSAALLFIVDIDDYLVPFWIYQRIHHYVRVNAEFLQFEEIKNGTLRQSLSEDDVRNLVETKLNGEYRYEKKVKKGAEMNGDPRSEPEMDCFPRIIRAWDTIYHFVQYVLFLIGFYVMPVVLTVCY